MTIETGIPRANAKSGLIDKKKTLELIASAEAESMFVREDLEQGLINIRVPCTWAMTEQLTTLLSENV